MDRRGRSQRGFAPSILRRLGTRQMPGDMLVSRKGHGFGREIKVAPRISFYSSLTEHPFCPGRFSLPQTTFSVRIDQLCRQYGKTFSQVQVSSGITKSLFYAIVNGTRNPKKDHIIKMGLAIGLSLEEVNELLKLAKLKELYAKNKEDAIVIFGLRNRLPISQIEELLIDAGVSMRLMEQ